MLRRLGWLVLLVPLAACATPRTLERAEGTRVERLDEGEAELEELEHTGRPPERGKVVDVLKGDELVLADGWVVRLIGIDVPTADYGKRSGNFYGKAALDRVRALVLGKEIELEYDEEPVDRYGRALAYVELDDGRMLNELLVQEGLALAACFPPNTSYCDRFAEAQHAAVQARKGLWNFDPDDWPQSDGRADNVVTGVRVKRVLDGDTIELEDGTIVRYIGIDAPESEEVWKKGAFGHEAYVFNKRLVEKKEVTIEYDVEFADPRGRELAYVYVVGPDGRKVMANAELVRAGLAWVAVFPPNVRHVRELFEAQKEAMEAGRGIWR